MSEFTSILKSETDPRWLKQLPNSLDLMLIDHAWCEKRAAAFAMRLIQSYPQYSFLLKPCSRLAREELRHFEMVLEIMAEYSIDFRSLAISGYGRALHQGVRSNEPERFVDLCLVAALIEARSCERFHAMIPYLPDEQLKQFYYKLYLAERRHFQLYLEFAERVQPKDVVMNRLQVLAVIEAQALIEPTKHFRVHSGIPA